MRFEKMEKAKEVLIERLGALRINKQSREYYLIGLLIEDLESYRVSGCEAGFRKPNPEQDSGQMTTDDQDFSGCL